MRHIIRVTLAIALMLCLWPYTILALIVAGWEETFDTFLDLSTLIVRLSRDEHFEERLVFKYPRD